MEQASYVQHLCGFRVDPRASSTSLRAQGFGLRAQGEPLVAQGRGFGVDPRAASTRLRVQGFRLKAQGDVLIAQGRQMTGYLGGGDPWGIMGLLLRRVSGCSS